MRQQIEALSQEIDREIVPRLRVQDLRDELQGDLWCTATGGRFISLNRAWVDVLGWSLEELRARPWRSFVHEGDLAATEAAVARLVGGEPLLGFENRYRCSDGSYVRLRWSARRTDGYLVAVARVVE